MERGLLSDVLLCLETLPSISQSWTYKDNPAWAKSTLNTSIKACQNDYNELTNNGSFVYLGINSENSADIVYSYRVMQILRNTNIAYKDIFIDLCVNPSQKKGGPMYKNALNSNLPIQTNDMSGRAWVTPCAPKQTCTDSGLDSDYDIFKYILGWDPL